MVYVTLLVVVLNLAYGACYRCFDNSRRLNQKVDDVVRTLQAGERWRDDVRASESVLPARDGVCLVQSNAAIEYLFYGNAIWRRTKTNEAWNLFLPDVKSSRMEKDARREVAAWGWQVELFPCGTPDRCRPFFTFEAVPGGSPIK